MFRVFSLVIFSAILLSGCTAAQLQRVGFNSLQNYERRNTAEENYRFLDFESYQRYRRQLSKNVS